MMDRNELTLAIAAALAGAFLLGWILRWFFGRTNAAGPRNAARTRDMAAQLHAAEDARHLAEVRVGELEVAAARRVAELEADLVATRDALAQARTQAEEIRAAYHQAMAGRERR